MPTPTNSKNKASVKKPEASFTHKVDNKAKNDGEFQLVNGVLERVNKKPALESKAPKTDTDVQNSVEAEQTTVQPNTVEKEEPKSVAPVEKSQESTAQGSYEDTVPIASHSPSNNSEKKQKAQQEDVRKTIIVPEGEKLNDVAQKISTPSKQKQVTDAPETKANANKQQVANGVVDFSKTVPVPKPEEKKSAKTIEAEQKAAANVKVQPPVDKPVEVKPTPDKPKEEPKLEVENVEEAPVKEAKLKEEPKVEPKEEPKREPEQVTVKEQKPEVQPVVEQKPTGLEQQPEKTEEPKISATPRMNNFEKIGDDEENEDEEKVSEVKHVPRPPTQPRTNDNAPRPSIVVAEEEKSS